MATTKTYVITPGGNTIVTGQQLILDGTPQTHSDGSAKLVPTGKHKTIIINSATPGSWASGDDFEITNLATNNTLNASFSGLDFTEVNPAAFSGIQLVNLTLGEHNVVVDGGFGTNGLPLFDGISTLTLKASAGGFLTFGSSSAPLEVLLTTVNAQSATATGSGISINVDPTLITTPVTVNFNFTNVGNSGGGPAGFSDDHVHGSDDVFAAGWGTNTGSATATTFNLTTTGKSFVELFTHGATNTTTVNISGTGSMTLFGVSDEFGNVATIKDTASGAQVITGGLQTTFATKEFTGFLTDNTALTSLTVTSTNTGNFVDLSSFESITGITISVAAGTVVLDDEVLFGSSPIVLGTPTNIGFGEVQGSSPGNDGTINWANLPTSANTLTFYTDVDNFPGSTLSVVNTPNTFTMNLQDENFNHNAFVITAATPAATNTFNLDIGSNAGTIGVLGATGFTPNDINENWTVTGYGNINIHLAGSEDVHLASEGGFFASAPGGGVAITISGSLVGSEMEFGNVSGVTLDNFDLFNSLAAQAARGVSTDDGTITDTAKTFLELGATDAVTITATTAGGLDMQDPDTDIDGTFVVTGSTHNFNNLQGTFGLFDGFLNNNGGEAGFAGKATINGGATADHIWDTGGAETINVNNVHTKVFVDQFQLNSGDDFAFAITSTDGGFDNNGGAGPKTAVINGFTPGFNGTSNTSFVDFNTDSWGVNTGVNYFGLVTGLGAPISGEGNHFADFSVIAGTGNFDVSDVVAYEIGGPFGSAHAVGTAITSTGGSFITLGLTAGHVYDLLVAYNNTGGGTNIADVQLLINVSGTTFDATLENSHDLATLSNVGLGKIIGTALSSNDVIHFNGA
jgi:hypothetical protein